MSSDDNSDDQKAPPMPSFSGNVMPMNVTIDVDDDIGEETTRRIGGATFNPTFEPVSFAPSITAPTSYISTTQQKVSVAPPPPTSLGGGWKLTSAPILPEFHPLDRNSVFCSGTSASEVAERVAQVLKERSIEAHFDNSKAKVRCLTAYNVDFRIFLYRGQKQYAHGTIVEVQRRTGASVLFVKDTQAILKAAQGNFVPPPPPSLFTTAEIPLVSDTEDDDDDYDSSASLSSLDFCAKLLNYKNHGSDMLALQTLASLTDPAKMGLSTSKKISRALVEPNSDVGSRVFALIVDKKKKDGDENMMIRNLAMTILSNTVQGVKGDLNNPMMREALLPVLIQELEKAEENPQMAYLAAKCLEPLIVNNIAGGHRAALYAVLDTAQSIGEARHAALRDVCEKCIRKVDDSR